MRTKTSNFKFIMNQSKAEKLFGHAKQNAKEYSLFEKLPAFNRMIKAWKSGEYKPKKRNILFSLFAIAYVISPFDFDWVAIIGWVDDFAIVAFAFNRIMKELDRFLNWENSRKPQNTIDTDAEVVG